MPASLRAKAEPVVLLRRMPQQGVVRATGVAIQTVLGSPPEPISLSPQAAALNERERVPVVIVGNAPPNTLGYRWARPNRFTPESKAAPSLVPERRTAMALHVYHPALSGPAGSGSGLYIVAYFTPMGRFIATATSRC